MRPPKPKRRHKVAEVTFDERARREFVTGFRKRRLQRQRVAKEKADEKARQARREERRVRRETLREFMGEWTGASGTHDEGDDEQVVETEAAEGDGAVIVTTVVPFDASEEKVEERGCPDPKQGKQGRPTE